MAGTDASQVFTLALWLGLGVLFALVFIGWLNLSRSRAARSWRARTADSRHALDATPEDYPHMHVVDGVTITHSHAGGERAHEHSTITVSMSHYAELVKRAERRQSS